MKTHYRGSMYQDHDQGYCGVRHAYLRKTHSLKAVECVKCLRLLRKHREQEIDGIRGELQTITDNLTAQGVAV